MIWAAGARSISPVLTLETLGKRWKWEKTKVWRFFQFYCAYFPLHRLPGSFGCVIYNRCYPTQDECDDPSDEEVMRILELIRIKARNTHTEGTDNERINRFVAWKSRKAIRDLEDEYTREEIQEKNKKVRISGTWKIAALRKSPL